MNQKLCTLHSYNYDKLEDKILSVIKPMLLKNIDYKITDEMYDRIKIKLDQEIQRLETDKNNIYKILMDSDNKKI